MPLLLNVLHDDFVSDIPRTGGKVPMCPNVARYTALHLSRGNLDSIGSISLRELDIDNLQERRIQIIQFSHLNSEPCRLWFGQDLSEDECSAIVVKELLTKLQVSNSFRAVK